MKQEWLAWLVGWVGSGYLAVGCIARTLLRLPLTLSSLALPNRRVLLSGAAPQQRGGAGACGLAPAWRRRVGGGTPQPGPCAAGPCRVVAAAARCPMLCVHLPCFVLAPGSLDATTSLFSLRSAPFRSFLEFTVIVLRKLLAGQAGQQAHAAPGRRHACRAPQLGVAGRAAAPTPPPLPPLPGAAAAASARDACDAKSS